MASGVRLCLVVLVCAGYTFQTSFQSEQKNVNNSLLLLNHNKTDINNAEIKQSVRQDFAKDPSLNYLNEIEDLKNVPDNFDREDKGACRKCRPVEFLSEVNDMLKGEPVKKELFNESKIENDVNSTVVELVDPLYKLREELKILSSLDITDTNDDLDSATNSTRDRSMGDRIKRSFEFNVPSITTEVADLLQSGSQNKGDMDTAAGHKSHKWSKGGGHKFKKEHHKKGGHKGDKGYKKKHHHKKGEHEKHGKDEHKKHYKKHSGHKKKHHDEAEKYGEHHKKEKGHKGAKYGEKKGHKKGHKTKGYHHKFHKDEYKKEHKFYDDYHKKGHHDKHGHHHKHHAKKEGKHKKGGHHKSAYHKDQYGKKGHKEGGHYDQEHKGHKGKKGHKKYHENHSDYGKKGGHKEGKKWGYSKKHKHGKHG